MDLQRNLEASVEKRTKETYGPPMGKRLLVFMDDLNMPRVRLKVHVIEKKNGQVYYSVHTLGHAGICCHL